MSDAKPLVAVTGATGFTGGALVRALLAEDYRVRALVRDGRRPTTDHPGLERITGDLADRQALAALVRGAEVVIHIAAKFRTEGPLEQFAAVNHRGTVNMLEAARSAGVRRFVHCSTIGVHGDVHRGPADEESPFNPRDMYQTTKVMAEDACREEMARGNMEIVIARPCSIYGPGDLRMLKMFRLLSHCIFLMIGDGKPNFHPVYIDDLVEGFLATMRVPEAAGEAFILGGPRYLPLDDYVATAAAALRSTAAAFPFALPCHERRSVGVRGGLQACRPSTAAASTPPGIFPAQPRILHRESSQDAGLFAAHRSRRGIPADHRTV